MTVTLLAVAVLALTGLLTIFVWAYSEARAKVARLQERIRDVDALLARYQEHLERDARPLEVSEAA